MSAGVDCPDCGYVPSGRKLRDGEHCQGSAECFLAHQLLEGHHWAHPHGDRPPDSQRLESGRHRRGLDTQPTWIDRSGRVLGLCWIAWAVINGVVVPAIYFVIFCRMYRL